MNAPYLPRNCWRVEILDGDWMPASGTHADKAHAEALMDAAMNRHPGSQLRLIRETTTSHVEAIRGVGHLPAGTNAEDCPACIGSNPSYPFLCPGPAS
ncbi:hypothetical protein ACFUAH_17030 [Streptomyces albidoflavus]|uniref:hypothetical protein n=1 Tax=Streptomyces albidoflavus TaxID=1886 RepID=UPI0007435ACD|nr:hypothetical protein [Streptomyces albidoflavus]KUL59650.1 hypothetical protein ADL32_18950 [Streptomyces albidoflavus]